MKARFEKHQLKFRIPAQTSRGSYTEKEIYLLYLHHENVEGVGEIAPLHDLSVDPVNELESTLELFCASVDEGKSLEEASEICCLSLFPSIQFALESAWLQIQNKRTNLLYESSFTQRKSGIPINGLVWMSANPQHMLNEAEAKIQAGFTCIKLKIGALDFDAECRMLEAIRKQYHAFKITLRVDANGAFHPDDADQKLKDLHRFELHSIEQPIKAGQLETMARICATSKVPIALDEELIGVPVHTQGDILIKTIKPQYLILKPTLLGGFKACDQWIQWSDRYHAGWWLTSALESNIGLNAIAQYAGHLNANIPQGLGTGMLFKKNFKPTTKIENGTLFYLGD